MASIKYFLAILVALVALVFPVVEAKCEPGFQCWEPMDFNGFQEDRTAKVRHNSNRKPYGHHDPTGRQTNLQRVSRK